MAIDQPARRRRVTVAELRSHRTDLARIGEQHGLSNIRVFGSVARGEADEDSDLDLLVDVAPGRGYFDMAGFALDVEQLLGVYTEVSTVSGLKSRIRDRVLAEAIRL
ncbi:nucleotidyltransferase family protein [Glycomyces paridis]|uniref:DNA polymerase subunit beta n=1 Tax=Glycomyces paridis TaxID=2126555 RepID=A0A4S8P2F7_9ACTN|nr:nucleotidyltransferase family protein [Glycomyces paridis]THV21774.1 DNA polymerase subunit beta [Glycomyces paridis]